MARRHGPGAVLWIDAHGDLNRPSTSPTGNVHGMPLAAALGRGGPGFDSPAWTLPALEAGRVAVIGARELDPGERALIGELGLHVYAMSQVDRRGIEAVVSEALERAEGAPFVHVSLDMDGLDPDVAPGVGTAVRGGLTYREAHLALELVAESGLLCCLEIVEVNPILDRQNATAALAVELAASAFGATTL
jgi:arginase